MNALKLEKKRILKEDGRYLLFYHSAASASPTQQEAFGEVEAEVETMTAPPTGAKTGSAQATPGQESADV